MNCQDGPLFTMWMGRLVDIDRGSSWGKHEPVGIHVADPRVELSEIDYAVLVEIGDCKWDDPSASLRVLT